MLHFMATTGRADITAGCCASRQVHLFLFHDRQSHSRASSRFDLATHEGKRTAGQHLISSALNMYSRSLLLPIDIVLMTTTLLDLGFHRVFQLVAGANAVGSLAVVVRLGHGGGVRPSRSVGYPVLLGCSWTRATAIELCRVFV